LHLIDGFRNRDLRKHVAHLMGLEEREYTAGQMTYDLRRLRRKGIICRVPATNLYRLTPYGWKVSVFVTRLHARLLRPGFAAIDVTPGPRVPQPLREAFEKVNQEIDRMLDRAKLNVDRNKTRAKAS